MNQVNSMQPKHLFKEVLKQQCNLNDALSLGACNANEWMQE